MRAIHDAAAMMLEIRYRRHAVYERFSLRYDYLDIYFRLFTPCNARPSRHYMSPMLCY